MLTLPGHFDPSTALADEPPLTLFALGHNDALLQRVAGMANVRPIALHRTKGQICHAEFRIFRIPPRVHSEYVGFVSCRWSEKFPNATPIEKLHDLPLDSQVVYAAAPTEGIDWVKHSEHVHPGLAALLPGMAAAMKLPLLPKAPTLWTSNFICHRRVWESYITAFATGLKYAERQWGTEPPFSTGKYDPTRKIAFLLERATMIYFASRSDLRIEKV